MMEQATKPDVAFWACLIIANCATSPVTQLVFFVAGVVVWVLKTFTPNKINDLRS